MERIASFCVDHTRLERGMYLSRQDGDVLTWDIRMKKPNQGDYLTTAAAHTLEHLFATYARNSAVKDGVIYVGPMGCRTGFYLLTRGLTPALTFLGIPPETAMLLLVRPISGSGALAAASDIIQTYGADSRIGRTAAVMLGSTETTFYVLAVYFGACGIRHSRWAIPAAIVADVTGFVTAAALVRCLWGT